MAKKLLDIMRDKITNNAPENESPLSIYLFIPMIII